MALTTRPGASWGRRLFLWVESLGFGGLLVAGITTPALHSLSCVSDHTMILPILCLTSLLHGSTGPIHHEIPIAARLTCSLDVAYAIPFARYNSLSKSLPTCPSMRSVISRKWSKRLEDTLV
jgi:hypothetical protein